MFKNLSQGFNNKEACMKTQTRGRKLLSAPRRYNKIEKLQNPYISNQHTSRRLAKAEYRTES